MYMKSRSGSCPQFMSKVLPNCKKLILRYQLIKSINLFMTDVSKYLRGLSPLIINDVFTLHQNNYNLRNCQLFEWNAIAARAFQPLKKVLKSN